MYPWEWEKKGSWGVLAERGSLNGAEQGFCGVGFLVKPEVM